MSFPSFSIIFLARSMPMLFPPIKPVPTSRWAMVRISRRVKYLSHKANILDWLPIKRCISNFFIFSCSSGEARPAASSALFKTTFQ